MALFAPVPAPDAPPPGKLPWHAPRSAVLAAAHRGAATEPALVQDTGLARGAQDVDVTGYTDAARCCAVLGTSHAGERVQAATRRADIGAEAGRSAAPRVVLRWCFQPRRHRRR